MTFDNILEEKIRNCEKCDLKGRGFAVERFKNFSKVMFVGEAPGAEEEKVGKPFVGRAGKELDMWVEALGVEDFIITNVVKHRPPDNRTPTLDEMLNCLPFLEAEIDYYRPKLLVLLGKVAVSIVDPKASLTQLVKSSYYTPLFYKGVRTLVLFHPSYSLRTGILPPLGKYREFIQNFLIP